MEDNEKLMKAAAMLKKYCEQMESCKNCIFSFKSNNDVALCRISKATCMPIGWKIPDMRRWTPADKALAKSLMEFGVKIITRRCGKVLFVDGFNCAEAPSRAFASLKEYETVNLEDIVGEE